MTISSAADWHNRGNAFYLQKDLTQAAACYAEALRLAPNDAGLCGNLGLVLRHLGRLDESIAFCRRAVQLQPHSAATHINLSLSLTANTQFDEAITHGREAVRLRPEFAQAHHCLGFALLRQHRWDEAAPVFRTALRLNPNLTEAHSNLAEALSRLGCYAEALTHFRQTQRLKPETTEPLLHQVYCLWQMKRFEEAAACVDDLLRRQPDSADGQVARAVIATKAGRPAEAVARFDRLLARHPDHAEAHFNRALALLLQGDFVRGFAEYEWRFQCPQFHSDPVQPGTWDGSSLTGRTILLRVEQGAGDTLQFVRLAPLLKQQGATVILSCYSQLMSLLSRCAGIDRVVDREAESPPFDVDVPLMSLPAKLGITLEHLSAAVPYLFTDRALEASWQQQVRALAGVKVGIAWQGNPDQPNDALRSVPLRCFAPLSRAGVALVSLQQGRGREQLGMAGTPPVVELPPRPGTSSWSFDDTAAVMKGLDLVITIDSAVAHLAGGLAVPVWVAVPFAPDWRWLLEREHSPWYPTMRLFRQPLVGDWNNVFECIAAELIEQLGQR